jgi:hypothetical protein
MKKGHNHFINSRIIVAIILVIYCHLGFAQNLKPHHEMLTLGGSKLCKSTSNDKLLIQQSIGQNIIGFAKANNFMGKQGFIQKAKDSRTKNAHDLLRCLTYPNPCVDVLNIKVLDQLDSKSARVIINDYFGKTVYNSIYSIDEVIHVPVRSLAKGAYLIKLTSKNQTFVGTFIKL